MKVLEAGVGSADHPLAATQLACGNRVVIPGAFSLTDLTTKNYLVELVNKKGDVVCTEGPFDLSKQPVKSDVFIECGKIPAAWWLVGAAAAAGITAGIVAGGNASPAR